MSKPNIVFVLADDMGFGDARCYDPEFSKIPTPNIDRLSREGMRFTDAHTASSLCSPSRYGLLTGRYAWRTTLQSGVLRPYDPPLIAEDRLTLPGFLRQNGYRTACVGKWHLGWDWPKRDGEVVFDEDVEGGPATRGFDWYFGTDVPNYSPYAFIENNRVQGLPTVHVGKDPMLVLNHPGPGLEGWQFDRILPTIAEKAVEYIHDRKEEPDPFFLFFPLTTPHEPIAPFERFRGKSGISGVGDLIMETDWALGEVMSALEESGLSEDTLLIFTTDNGHCFYTGVEPFEEAGHRVSGPFRGYKADIWEGGHRVPFVVRWPNHIAPDTNNSHTICLTDLLATCADLLGEELPDDAGEDSMSILSLLKGEDIPVRSTSIFHSGGGFFAVYEGPWKLALCRGSGGRFRPEEISEDAPDVQLYNLKDDPSEQRNLAEENQAVVDRLVNYLEQAVASGRTTTGAEQENDALIDVLKPERN